MPLRLRLLLLLLLLLLLVPALPIGPPLAQQSYSHFLSAEGKCPEADAPVGWPRPLLLLLLWAPGDLGTGWLGAAKAPRVSARGPQKEECKGYFPISGVLH